MTTESSNVSAELGIALPASRAYRQFIGTVFPNLKERALIDTLPAEIELQSLWFSGAFGRKFRSTRGEVVEIVQFGHWNHAAGPDFGDAAVSINGQVCRGTIELDSDVRDWELHRHGANPNYDKVVLHLYFHAPGGVEHFTRTSSHREVPQVRLSIDLIDETSARHPYEAEAHLGRCSAPLEEMAANRIESLLESAAQFRMGRKGARLRKAEEIHGREGALYHGIAEALGYRPNKLPMRVLAQRVPLGTLRNMASAEREAVLFGMAGFLEDTQPQSVPPETRRYLGSLWEHWWKRRDEFSCDAERVPAWKIAGVRPVNHPHRRIATLATIIDRWGMLSSIVDPAGTFSASTFFDFCAVLEHPYWESHFTLNADATRKPMALIGESRATEILANQIYPLLAGRQSSVWEDYKRLPAKLDNGKVRRAALRLFGEHPLRKTFLRKVYHQQALLQIYEDFCLEDDSDCIDCPFPEQLRQWR